MSSAQAYVGAGDGEPPYSGLMRHARLGTTDGDRAELARLEERLQRCWRDLAEAEQRGVPEQLLERKYAGYLRLLDAYLTEQRRQRGRALRSCLAS